MENLSEEEIAEFREIFSLVDKDGGGSITGDELGELMDTLGIEATPEEINGMIAEVRQWKNSHFTSLHFTSNSIHSSYFSILYLCRLMPMVVEK